MMLGVNHKCLVRRTAIGHIFRWTKLESVRVRLQFPIDSLFFIKDRRASWRATCESHLSRTCKLASWLRTKTRRQKRKPENHWDPKGKHKTCPTGLPGHSWLLRMNLTLGLQSSIFKLDLKQWARVVSPLARAEIENLAKNNLVLHLLYVNCINQVGSKTSWQC